MPNTRLRTVQNWKLQILFAGTTTNLKVKANQDHSPHYQIEEETSYMVLLAQAGLGTQWVTSMKRAARQRTDHLGICWNTCLHFCKCTTCTKLLFCCFFQGKLIHHRRDFRLKITEPEIGDKPGSSQPSLTGSPYFTFVGLCSSLPHKPSKIIQKEMAKKWCTCFGLLSDMSLQRVHNTKQCKTATNNSSLTFWRRESCPYKVSCSQEKQLPPVAAI